MTTTALPPRPAAARPGQGGFTLIELMVVLMIIGIGTAAIGLTVAGDPARALRQEAQLLTQRFIVAQSEARLDGRSIVWQADQEGYRFTRRNWQPVDGSIVPALSAQDGLDTFSRDDTLQPRRWQSGAVRVSPNRGLVLGREPVTAPWTLELSDGSITVTIRRDAAGRYAFD